MKRLFVATLLAVACGCGEQRRESEGKIDVVTEADVHFNRGVELEREYETEEALAAYSRAIELDPNHAKAFNNRGVLQSLRSRALADFDEAIRCDPLYARAYGNRGVERFFARQFEEAERDYSHALKIAPESWRVSMNRGEVRIELARYAGAVADYTDALENGAVEGEAGERCRSGRARARRLAGDLPGALEDLDALVGHKGFQGEDLFGDEALHLRRGRVLMELGRLRDAKLEGYRVVYSSFWGDPFAYLLLAEVFHKSGDLEVALDYCGDAMSACTPGTPVRSWPPKCRRPYRAALLRRAAFRREAGDEAGALADERLFHELPINSFFGTPRSIRSVFPGEPVPEWQTRRNVWEESQSPFAPALPEPPVVISPK